MGKVPLHQQSVPVNRFNMIMDDPPEIDPRPWKRNFMQSLEETAHDVVNSIFGETTCNGQLNIERLEELLIRGAKMYTIDDPPEWFKRSLILLVSDFNTIQGMRAASIIPFIRERNKNIYKVLEFNRKQNPLWRKWFTIRQTDFSK